MFDTRTRLFFFACLKDAAGAALKNVAPAPGSDQKRNRLQLRNTAFLIFLQLSFKILNGFSFYKHKYRAAWHDT